MSPEMPVTEELPVEPWVVALFLVAALLVGVADFASRPFEVAKYAGALFVAVWVGISLLARRPRWVAIPLFVVLAIVAFSVPSALWRDGAFAGALVGAIVLAPIRLAGSLRPLAALIERYTWKWFFVVAPPFLHWYTQQYGLTPAIAFGAGAVVGVGVGYLGRRRWNWGRGVEVAAGLVLSFIATLMISSGEGVKGVAEAFFEGVPLGAGFGLSAEQPAERQPADRPRPTMRTARAIDIHRGTGDGR